MAAASTHIHAASDNNRCILACLSPLHHSVALHVQEKDLLRRSPPPRLRYRRGNSEGCLFRSREGEDRRGIAPTAYLCLPEHRPLSGEARSAAKAKTEEQLTVKIAPGPGYIKQEIPRRNARNSNVTHRQPSI